MNAIVPIGLFFVVLGRSEVKMLVSKVVYLINRSRLSFICLWKSFLKVNSFKLSSFY